MELARTLVGRGRPNSWQPSLIQPLEWDPVGDFLGKDGLSLSLSATAMNSPGDFLNGFCSIQGEGQNLLDVEGIESTFFCRCVWFREENW